MDRGAASRCCGLPVIDLGCAILVLWVPCGVGRRPACAHEAVCAVEADRLRRGEPEQRPGARQLREAQLGQGDGRPRPHQVQAGTRFWRPKLPRPPPSASSVLSCLTFAATPCSVPGAGQLHLHVVAQQQLLQPRAEGPLEGARGANRPRRGAGQRAGGAAAQREQGRGSHAAHLGRAGRAKRVRRHRRPRVLECGAGGVQAGGVPGTVHH
mmetsp:Transcript_26790/g.71730  ORF Transcript_26790/g.71730 Transcript_26790/m.71730 type:complete len:211 (+) Transcript_26790:1697-2329(+)